MTAAVRKGTKIGDEEAKALDPSRCQPSAAEADVEGQDASPLRVECPWCGTVQRDTRDPELYTWMKCAACGRPFRT